ncbi:ltaA [Symbiodinium necroappetens]|uniref:LtaA protein n=1 Tax=Symbiodinium necroappetens TaxID=1628268 RepID=A0A812U0T3_9DINO|nr:ltaA [Symbiodinium necroappetens]
MARDTVDLRSDTVTRPTDAMREAMMRAELGDDVLGDDPTVRALEERVASVLGKDAACFVPSGTMANQACVRAQTEPGDEIVAHEGNHVYVYEGGAWAAVSGCSIALLRGDRGMFSGEDVRRSVRPDDTHFPRTRLVCVENTHNRGGGAVWPLARLRDVTETAHGLGLRTHLDGARLWNAHVASGVALDELARGFDTVSVCFSKGLGAPVGSAAAGDASTIRKVRRLRKMLGGGMRQSGLLAGAALHALDHHVDRLAEDHEHAHLLASALSRLPGFRVDPESVETNIVYATIAEGSVAGGAAGFVRTLSDLGVRILAVDNQIIRVVTSLAVDRTSVARAIEAFEAAASRLCV